MMVVIAMAVMSVGFASCGGDDDDEPGGGDNSELVAKLQGAKSLYSYEKRAQCLNHGGDEEP